MFLGVARSVVSEVVSAPHRVPYHRRGGFVNAGGAQAS